MKRIITICLLSFISFSIFAAPSLAEKDIVTRDSLNKTQLYNDMKGLYKEDVKGIIKYSFGRADTLVQKGFTALSKGVNHTYDILKTQQLVKSLHHLFYWLLAIILMIIIASKFKTYMKDKSEALGWTLVVLTMLDISLFSYNGMNFMEMWTGFINPEYGVYKDILEIINNQSLK